MYAVTSPSEIAGRGEPLLPAYIRAKGRIRCRFARGPDGRTRLAELGEGGGYRLKLPRGPACEGVILNTGGGMAGGDSLAAEIALDAGADAVVTTQSAEKIYRAQQDPAAVRLRLELGSGAGLAWLPQETILFDGARLDRRLEAAIAPDSRLLIAEMTVLGRAAMGETFRAGALIDHWRIRRDGRLVFAEALRLEGAVEALLAAPCTGAGARAFATILLVDPHAESLLEETRVHLTGANCETGASAWNGLLLIRLLGREAAGVRAAAATLLRHIEKRALPRVWS
jgi:urease accessory protein